MIIVCYDFVSNKKRAKFSKFLKKYGYKVQYSVYMIRNSRRILKNILTEIDLKYKKTFENTDSILIFSVCEGCKKEFDENYPFDDCDVCGSKVFKKRIKL